MAIGTTNISLGNIYGEVNDTLPGGTNVSLKTQSESAANTTHTSTISGYTSPGGGLTGAPYGMGEFGGYINLQLDSFPNLSNGYLLGNNLQGNTGLTGFNYRKEHFSQQVNVQVGAFATIGFKHDTANDRILLRFFSGTQQYQALVWEQKIDYVGLGSATWTCNYEYHNRSVAIATLTQGNGSPAAVWPGTTTGGSLAENTYHSIPTSSYRYFYHRVTANYSNFNDNGEARLGNAVIFSDQTNDVRFNVKATLNGTDYTATSSSFAVSMIAKRGFAAP